MKAKILWIESKRANSPSFLPSLRKKGFSVEAVSSGNEALERLFDINPDLVVVYAASMRTSGRRICRSLRERIETLPIVVICMPEHPLTDEPCVNVSLTLPFTSRKLINRILPLLPGNNDEIVHVGPIRYDPERKQVRCNGRETPLTPRLAHLLSVFIRYPGEVLERERLFREVWATEYTGDTRTLDVHISWLRQALEEDPRKPRLIKTIRGVGYRLDII